MKLSESENRILLWAVSAMLLFSLGMYIVNRYKLKKELAKQEKVIKKQDEVLKQADLVVYFLKQKVAEDSIVITSYEHRINILYQQLNSEKEKTKGYEHLVNKKPTDPVRIVSVDDAELFLSRRYFPAQPKGKANGK
jgi:uncharacterized protein (UPF0371 family)